MRYKLSIGNLSSVFIFIYAIYSILNPGTEGWGLLIGLYLIFFALCYFTFDIILQRLIKNFYILNIIEIIPLIYIYFLLFK